MHMPTNYYRKVFSLSPKHTFDEQFNIYKMWNLIKKPKTDKYIVFNRKIYVRIYLIISEIYWFKYADSRYKITWHKPIDQLTISDVIVYYNMNKLPTLTPKDIIRDGTVQEEETEKLSETIHW